MTILEAIREQALRRPAHPALIVERQARGAPGRGAAPPERELVSYAELVAQLEAFAKRLRAEGVAQGDRCGLVARQGRGFVEAALGILAAEACLVPIPDDHRGEVLERFAQRAQLHHLLLEEDDFACRRRAEARAVDGADDRDFRALSPAYLRFTSGSTSRRKGVVLGHATILERLDAANRGLSIGPDDRVLWLLPMAHHFVVSILLYLSRGASILLPGSSLARPVLELAARERASVLYASPYHLNLLSKDGSELALDALRLAVSTAEGLRADVAHRFAERFGTPVVQALGIIEVGLPVMNRDSAAQKPEALGRPLPDYEVWLRGKDGRPLVGETSPERSGEICIRGPGLLDAYMDPWLPAREVLEPDGFRTGDQGWFDADGDLHLVGRRTNRINMAGMKFFSEEVEAALDQHPGVERSRVFAREHAHLGEIPAAEILPRDAERPPAPKELMRYCRGLLPAYKIPREFRMVEALDLTETGKLRRS